MGFKDRLERLHDSRRRQKERAEQTDGGEDDQSVYYADKVDEEATSPATESDTSDDPSGNPDVSRETPDPTPPAESTGQVYDKLKRSDAMKQKSRRDEANTTSTGPGTQTPDDAGSSADRSNDPIDDAPRTLTIRREGEAGRDVRKSPPEDSFSSPKSLDTASNGTPDREDLGRWIAALRREASDSIDEGDWEAAAPKLFEIVALKPNHPFALEKLAEYHSRRDEEAPAQRYRARLRRQSPFE